MSIVSTNGSVSTSITGDSLAAPKIVVVREDIYKGATLLGTTYRNISFTTTYVTPIPSITFNGTATTFTTQQTPTSFVSTTFDTVLTFANSTVAPFNGNWDNSVMTVTIPGVPGTNSYSGTSTTGTISATVRGYTLLAVQYITVQEDIYKGATLLGTTYRNISFTSTFRLSSQRNSNAIVFADTRSVGTNINKGAYSLFDINVANPSWRLDSNPVEVMRVSVWYYFSLPGAAGAIETAHLATTFPYSYQLKEPISGGYCDLTTGGKTYSALVTGAVTNATWNISNGGTGWPARLNGWNRYVLEYTIPDNSRVYLSNLRTWVPSDANRVNITASAAYLSNTNAVPKASLFTGTGSFLTDCYPNNIAGSTVFRIDKTKLVGSLYMQFRGKVDIKYNDSTWNRFESVSTGQPESAEFAIPASGITSDSLYNYVELRGAAVAEIKGFSYMQDPQL